MDNAVLKEALILEKRIYNTLSEVLDMTKQLASVVDSSDEVSMRMMLAMREEPIAKLRNIRKALETLRDSLVADEKTRFAALLNGAEAIDGEETLLANQIASNNRLLNQLLELDKNVSLKLGRDRSVYSQGI